MAEPSGQKATIYLVSAVFFGLVAAGLSFLFLKSREAALIAEIKGKEDELVQVVVAKDNLPKGLQIKVDYFDIASIPGKFVHPNTIRPDNFFGYVGRFLNTEMQAGKTLLDSFLVEQFPVDFSDLVAQGRRAITITVDEVTTFSGLMRPGNRIDLYVNIGTGVTGFAPQAQAGGGTEGLQEVAATAGGLGPAAAALLGSGLGAAAIPKDVVLPVLQDVKVLATGRETYRQNLDQLSYPQQRLGQGFTTVTVDVTPKQAALLAIAEDKGDLIAVLRNRNDRSAAEFTGVTPLDLFNNARQMKKIEAMRQAAAAVGATIDENGNWVTKDGRVINKDDIVVAADGTISTKGGASLAPSEAIRKAAAAAGATIDANGNWVTKDGKVISPDNIVVAPDGTVRTKDGKVLAPSEALLQAAAAAGATIDENGNWVTADGKVIKAEDIIVSPDGTVTTKAGTLLAAKGIRRNEQGQYVDENGKVIDEKDIVFNPDGSVTTKQALMKEKGFTVNENGDYVDATGKVVSKDDVIVNADGSVTTKDEVMAAAGYTVNENGDYVDANGNVVKKDDIQVLANGTVMTMDGKVVSGPPVTKTKDGFLVTADGTVMTADGKVLQGVTVNENGGVVTANGQVLRDPNLTVDASGAVRDASGNVISGITGSNLPPAFTRAATGAAPAGAAAVQRLFIALTIGGSSKDGVATTTLLPVQPLAQPIAQPGAE